MRKLFIISFVSSVALGASDSRIGMECTRVTPGTIHVCESAGRYRISLEAGCDQNRAGANGSGVFSRDQPIAGLTSYLGRVAGAAVFHFGSLTETDTDCREVDAPDAMSAIKAFCDRVGLRFESPRADVWLVGGPWFVEKAGVEVTARPVYSDQFGYRKPAEMKEIEWAIIRAVGSHDAPSPLGVSIIRYLYWWIDGERDALLVSVRSESQDGAFSNSSTHKVRIARAGTGWLVQEVWQAGDSPGPLVPEFSDDVDGDGVRDYLLDYEARDNSHYALISGIDGRLLARFRGWIAYDPGRPGPKRIAVRELLGEYGEPPRGVQALDFSGGTPAEISIPRKKQGTGAGHDSSPYGPDAAVARLLGDPGRVRSIVGGTYSNEERASPEAMRKAQERRNLPRCELGEQAAGACERVHFRYISPGLKKRMEDAAKRAADSK